ncbi:hypothetical protein OOT46_05045 [Aquabacterium sp. A7-Y]|uniref:hypothetical protein n=1 Tax=Aquabacterium sp. A7-Y TaxID=1349605 RepID=UPI00223D70A4|nr:hypothetical protein [Aquabacterium sp. A7-Y]MCW7537216.1 hypothetical protein [Aquabacterium sp. A7-Y]
MIVRFLIERSGAASYAYEVSADAAELYSDDGLTSVEDCLRAAAEGCGDDIAAAEVWYGGIVSGTYPLATLLAHADQVAEHALNTTSAVAEALIDVARRQGR